MPHACERGRETLLELLRPLPANKNEKQGDEEDWVPVLGPETDNPASGTDAALALVVLLRMDSVVLTREQKQQQGIQQVDGVVVGLERLSPPRIE